MNLCIRESRFLCENSQAELISLVVNMRDQSSREMATCSPCPSAWVNCQTCWHWGSSLRIAREMLNFTSTWSDEPIGVEEEQETSVGKFVMNKSKLGGFAIGRNLCQNVHRLSQSHGVTEIVYWSAKAGERGTTTQPCCVVTIEIATYGEKRVGMSG